YLRKYSWSPAHDDASNGQEHGSRARADSGIHPSDRQRDRACECRVHAPLGWFRPGRNPVVVTVLHGKALFSVLTFLPPTVSPVCPMTKIAIRRFCAGAALCLFATVAATAQSTRIQPNDNRVPGGKLENGV